MSSTMESRSNAAEVRLLFSKRAVVATFFVVAGIQWARLVHKPDGDFHLHWELGRRMAAGEYLYAHGTDAPYPPFWGLAHLPLSVFSDHWGQVVAFPLFFVAFGTLLWSLRRLTEQGIPLTKDAAFWAAAAAVALCSRYLVRDMVEVGVNLFLVAMSYLGVWLWTERKEWWGGISLGLAMALKCTPSLFLVWFLYKRQWKMALTTTVAATAFTVSPALVMGPAEFARIFAEWAGRVVKGVAADDPTHGVLGEEAFQNMNLKLALARYLTTVKTTTYVSRPDHPWYFDALDLPPQTAKRVIQAVLASLLLGVGWIYRHPVTDRKDVGLAWECAGLSLLILLYSPITWGQHCVGLLPALYLVCRRRASGVVFGRWEAAMLGGYVTLVLVLNRGFLGKDLARLLVSYRVTTISIVMMLIITMAARRRLTAAAAERRADDSEREGVPAVATVAVGEMPLRRAA